MMENIMRIVTSILFILITSLSLNACNTIKGAGKDIKAGGEKIENVADRSKHRHDTHQ